MNAATLTAEWLREPRENGCIPISAELGPVLADALDEADDSFRCLIECECKEAEIAGVRWYDIGTADGFFDLGKALRYLTARGKIAYLPDLHGGKRLVRFLP